MLKNIEKNASAIFDWKYEWLSRIYASFSSPGTYPMHVYFFINIVWR